NTAMGAKPGTVGRVLSGCELKLESGSHHEESLAEGAGEICVKSNAMMLGYLKDGKVVRSFDAEGWYRTGDLGKIDSAGYLTITDRIKDLIVTSDGKKVSPVMLEHQYRQIPHVKEFIIIGLQDEQIAAQQVCALVVPTHVSHKDKIEVAFFEQAS